MSPCRGSGRSSERATAASWIRDGGCRQGLLNTPATLKGDEQVMTIEQVQRQGFVLFPHDLTKEPLILCKVDRCTNLVDPDATGLLHEYCEQCADDIAYNTHWDMKEMERRGE